MAAILGLNQKKLAHHLGIDPYTLRNWENGKRQPSERHYKNIMWLLKKSL
ncbi:MAG: helix-turn-helix domain-containing protein [Candidatus Brocadiales bacterium]